MDSLATVRFESVYGVEDLSVIGGSGRASQGECTLTVVALSASRDVPTYLPSDAANAANESMIVIMVTSFSDDLMTAILVR